jgi:hypothetical protein
VWQTSWADRRSEDLKLVGAEPTSGRSMNGDADHG